VWYNSRDMATEKVAAPAPPVGVIESLSQGFETVAGHTALLLLPLLLDLFLWMGPRISLKDYYQDVWLPTVNDPATGLKDAWPEFLGAPEDIVKTIPDAQFLPIIGMPSVLAGTEAHNLPFNYTPPVEHLKSALGLVALNVLAYGAGIIVLTIYFSTIAAQVSGQGFRATLLRLPLNLLQLGALGIALPILLLILMAPFLLVAAVMALISSLLALGVMLIGLMIALWFSLFCLFTVHGMFMHRRNALSALWDSVRVVQWNMTSTLMLMMIILLIDWGAGIVWGLVASDSWLMLLAIAGHAFATTGLIAATFVFYKDRYRYWREMREALLAELQRRRTQNRTPL
jgi:hypothetical protein